MWTKLRSAFLAPVNLFVGTNAVMVSAITWNPLAVVLYAIGEPIWLYYAMTKPPRCSLAQLERQFGALVNDTPCAAWIRKRLLPDYPRTYAQLVETRAYTARIVSARDDDAALLEAGVVDRMDDMLRAYIKLASERLLFHCSLAKVYPLADDLGRWSDDTAFVTIDDAQREVNAKIAGFEAELSRQPELGEVYSPILGVLAKRRDELARRAQSDRQMAAQLKVFPDQFELILSKLATPSSDHGEVVGAMTLLLEQTEDAASFAEEMRAM
jgi:hypothetical protein